MGEDDLYSGTPILQLANAVRAKMATGAQYLTAKAPSHQLATRRRAAIGAAGRPTSSRPRTRNLLVGVIALLAFGGASPAGAQVVTDYPEADTPSGKIYEIPLEGARADGAPRPPTQSSPPAPRSSVRSEHGLGSSSRVPAARLSPAPDGRQGDGSQGKRSDVPREQREPGPRPEAKGGSTEVAGASNLGAYGVLLALAVLGLGAGMAGRRNAEK